MDKITTINKALDGKGKEIFSIFFSDWCSLKEASKIYDPSLPEKCRNHRTVAYYFYMFKKLGFLEENNKIKEVPRKTATGKDSIYPSKCRRYRANYEAFFSEKNIPSNMEEILLFFLNQDIVRSYLIQNYKYDIPSGVEDVIKQLLLISISAEGSDALGADNILDTKYNTTIFKVQDINFKSYKSSLKKNIEEIETKIVAKEKFRVLLNLFASVMAYLFFPVQMRIEKISPFFKDYLWLSDMWNHLKYTNLKFIKDLQ